MRFKIKAPHLISQPPGSPAGPAWCRSCLRSVSSSAGSSALCCVSNLGRHAKWSLQSGLNGSTGLPPSPPLQRTASLFKARGSREGEPAPHHVLSHTFPFSFLCRPSFPSRSICFPTFCPLLSQHGRPPPPAERSLKGHDWLKLFH